MPVLPPLRFMRPVVHARSVLSADALATHTETEKAKTGVTS